MYAMYVYEVHCHDHIYGPEVHESDTRLQGEPTSIRTDG